LGNPQYLIVWHFSLHIAVVNNVNRKYRKMMNLSPLHTTKACCYEIPIFV